MGEEGGKVGGQEEGVKGGQGRQGYRYRFVKR